MRLMVRIAFATIFAASLTINSAAAQEPGLVPDSPVAGVEDGTASLWADFAGTSGTTSTIDRSSHGAVSGGQSDSGSSGDSPSSSGSGGSSGSWAPVPYDPVYGYHGDGWVFVDEHSGEVIPECVVGVKYVCPSPRDLAAVAAAAPGVGAAPAGAAPAPPTFAETEAMVTRVLVQLEVPRPAIRIGPDPSVNEWNMAVVGYPLWLWTDEPAARAASVSAFGYTFDLSATRDSVTYDLGDGSAPVTCTATTPYPGGAAVVGVPSPTCGHTYVRPSLPAGTYLVRATARWTVSWSALGHSGTLPMPLTAMRRVPVGELQSIRQS